MSKTRNLSDLLDANGDVKSTALDNVALTGIDDNADATAITIDSSENVFVKTTGTATSIGVDSSSTGFYLRNGGQFRVARDNSQPIIANRLNGDGVIIDCKKDGTTVGQLGGNGCDLYIASTTSGHKGFRFGNGAIVPSNTSGGTDDNATTLGSATQRFANLYLGGNIYLGGT